MTPSVHSVIPRLGGPQPNMPKLDELARVADVCLDPRPDSFVPVALRSGGLTLGAGVFSAALHPLIGDYAAIPALLVGSVAGELAATAGGDYRDIRALTFGLSLATALCASCWKSPVGAMLVATGGALLTTATKWVMRQTSHQHKERQLQEFNTRVQHALEVHRMALATLQQPAAGKTVVQEASRVMLGGVSVQRKQP